MNITQWRKDTAEIEDIELHSSSDNDEMNISMRINGIHYYGIVQVEEENPFDE